MVGSEKLINISRVFRVSMAKQLHHFDVHGVAESTRMMLHYGKSKFDDVRYKHTEEPAKHIKATLPFGKLPLYQEGNKTLGQPLAIARYCGAQNKLVPTDDWEAAKADDAAHNINDFWSTVLTMVNEPDPAKKAEQMKVIKEQTVDYFFSKFENDLKDNNGFFIGKVSWADFVLVGVVEATNLQMSDEIEKKYPHVVALIKKVRTLPGVKDYIAKRKPLVL